MKIILNKNLLDKTISFAIIKQNQNFASLIKAVKYMK